MQKKEYKKINFSLSITLIFKAFFLKAAVIFFTAAMIIFLGTECAGAEINTKVNYQGKLTDSTGVAVVDGAYDVVFRFYTAAGGGTAIWTESWTNAALFTDTNITYTANGCASGVDRVAYTSQTNEATLAAGQLLWNITKKESAVIESVVAASDYVCVYSAPSTWSNGDDVTNRIFVKGGLFSVMMGGVQSLDAVNMNQPLFLGVTVGSDSEMKPRKMIGAVPAAFEARQLVGKTWSAPDAIGSTTANTGAFTTLSAATSSAATVFTANQSGTGWVVDFQKSGASKVMIDNSGNVGIGTTSPTVLLEVAGNANLNGSRVNIGGSAAGASFHYGSTGLMYKNSVGGRSLMEIHSPDGTGKAVLQVLDGGSFYIQSLTATPTIFSNNYAGSYLRIDGNTVGRGIRFSSSGASTPVGLGLADSVLQVTDGSTGFGTLAAGSIGIGTTTPLAKLSINGGLHVGGDSDPGDNNALIDGTLGVTGAVTLTTDLGVASGGTGVSTFTANGVLYGNGATSILATAQGGANTVLVANAGAPSFSSAITVGTSVSSPIFQGAAAAVTFGNASYTTTIAGSGLTISPTAWTATPTISGLITATGGLTANGTLTANGAVVLGDGGDDIAINSNDWDISSAGAISGITTIGMSGQLTSTLATGTAPFAVTSTTVNSNLNADLLDGQHSSYYAPLGNISGTDHYVAKFNGTSALENSLIFDNGTNVGIGTASPVGKLNIEGSIYAQNGLTQNLVLDPQFTSYAIYWGNVAGGVQTNETMDNGDIVNGLEVNTTTNVSLTSDYVPVNPYKTYRFSIWMKEDNNDSTLYFGEYAYNSSKAQINTYNSAGTGSTNYYFWAGDLATTGKWYRKVGYLLPCNTSNSWTNPSDTTSSNYRMDCATAYVRLRFYNLDAPSYGTGAGTDAHFVLPSIEEVQESTPVFSLNGSDYIIKPSGNVGIGTVSPENGEGWTRVLDVYGVTTSKIISTTNAVQTGIWSHNSGFYSSPAGGIAGTKTNHPYSLITNSSARLTIDTSGNVGIGITGPSQKFDVNGTFRSRGNAYFDSALYFDNATSIPMRADVPFHFLTDGGAAQQGKFKGIQVSTSYAGTIPDNGILFSTDSTLYRSAATQLRTNSTLLIDGSLSIGNTDPGSYKFNVTGDTYLNGTATAVTSVSSPIFQGNTGAVTFGNASYVTTIAGSTLTVSPTAWTATPTISGLITATGGLTANGTLTANGAVVLGDGGDDIAINSNDWDISSAGAISGITTIGMSGQLTSTLATGTAPFAVTSTTVNSNLNADLLDGQHGSYYAPLGNISGTDHYVAKFNGTSALENSLIFDDGTNVGIGTTSPLQNLHIAGADGDTRIRLTDTLASGYGVFEFYNDTGLSGAFFQNGSTNAGYGGANSFGMINIKNAPLALGTNNAVQMIILGNGNVGIGTASPGAKLEVGAAADAASNAIRVLSGDGYNAGFEAYGSAQGTGYLYVGQSSSYGGGIFYNGDGNPAFATGESSDAISFYRNAAGTNEVVFSYPYNSNTVTFRGGTTITSTLTANGAVVLGDGGDDIAINSNDWDISSAGAISGITTIGMSGQLTSTLAAGTAPFAVTSTTVNTNLNADLLDGQHASSLQFYQSNRDFANGTLIQTNIDYSVTNGEPFLLEIEGNSYGSQIPFDIKIQGYIYSDTIINSGGISNGTNLTGLVAFNYNGYLCFWFPRQAYWQGFSVFVNDSHGGVKENRLVSISDVAKPGGITKEVAFTVQQSFHAGNDGSGSGLDADLWDGNQFASYLNQAVLTSSSPTFAGLTLNGTLTANGQVVLGDGGDDIAINSNDWDISSAGVVSGLTGLTSSGTINFSGLTASRLVATDASKNLVSTITLANLVSSVSDVSGSTGTTNLVLSASPTLTGTLSAAAATFSGTLTANGAVVLGDGGDDIAINSNDWDISSAGAISGITTIGMSGQLTSTLATGTAPFAVTSTTVNTNLNADLLDGQHDSYFSRAATTQNSIISFDSRNTNFEPQARNAGLYADFIANATDGLSDGGTYHGVLTFRSYGSGSDLSGGYPIELGYTTNGNLWTRMGTSTTAWGSWYKIWNQNNDGASSGLDADLLDGQHGSYYAPLGNISGTDHYVAKFNGTSALENSLIFDNGTNVGIGTASPGAKLHIFNNQGGASGRILIDANVTSGYDSSIYETDTGLEFSAISNIRGFEFKTGASPTSKMSILGNGNVGIGTTAPGSISKLQVETPEGYWGLALSRSGTIAGGLYSNGGILTLAGGYANINFSPATGYVGIGTTTPQAKLDINAGSGNKAIAFDGSNNRYIDFLNGGYKELRFYSYDDTGTFSFGMRSNGKFAVWSTADGSNWSEKFDILGNGNVGIGTASPAAKLHIVGGGLALCTSTACSSTEGGRRSIQLSTDTDYGGTYNDHTGSLIYSTMPGGWGTSQLEIRHSTNWGTYATAADMVIGDHVGIGTTTPDVDGAKFAIQNYSDGVNRLMTAFIPDLANTSWIGFGRAASSYNSGWLGFTNVSTGSQSNYMTLAIFGADNIVNVTGYGRVGLGITNPSYQLQLSTDSAGKPNGGTWANSSDVRLKTSITTMTGALDKVMQLRGVNFNWINQDEHPYEQGLQGGFIAQEVEAVFPSWVKEVDGIGKDGVLTGGKTKSLSLPFEFDALLVEAIKEQQVQIEELKLQLTEQGLIASTSTAETAGESGDSLMVKVKNILKLLGLAIQDGVASLTEVIADRFTAKIARIERLEMVDKSTGAVYCTWVENGEWKKTQGNCNDVVAISAAVPQTVEPVTASTTVSTVQIPAASEIVPATSTVDTIPAVPIVTAAADSLLEGLSQIPSISVADSDPVELPLPEVSPSADAFDANASVAAESLIGASPVDSKQTSL